LRDGRQFVFRRTPDDRTRGAMGSFYHVSLKHLQRYCNEFSCRWNKRESTDEVRTAKASRWDVPGPNPRRANAQRSRSEELVIL
jgi:hypothetical protein